MSQEFLNAIQTRQTGNGKLRHTISMLVSCLHSVVASHRSGIRENSPCDRILTNPAAHSGDATSLADDTRSLDMFHDTARRGSNEVPQMEMVLPELPTVVSSCDFQHSGTLGCRMQTDLHRRLNSVKAQSVDHNFINRVAAVRQI